MLEEITKAIYKVYPTIYADKKEYIEKEILRRQLVENHKTDQRWNCFREKLISVTQGFNFHDRSLEGVPCFKAIVFPKNSKSHQYIIEFLLSVLQPYFCYYVHQRKIIDEQEMLPYFLKYFEKAKFVSDEEWHQILEKEGAAHLSPKNCKKTYFNTAPEEVRAIVDSLVECQKICFAYSLLPAEVGSTVIEEIPLPSGKIQLTVADRLFDERLY